MKNIYVGNLSWNLTEDELRQEFEAHGEVSSCKMITDRDTGRPRGFAFVEMASDSDAQSAIQALDGKELDGRNIRVNEAKPREENRGGYGGGNRGGGGGGGRNRY